MLKIKLNNIFRIIIIRVLNLKNSIYFFLIGVKKFRIGHTSNIPSSKRIYIVGSGKSINKINNAQWGEIYTNDSMALNFAILHPLCFKYALIQMTPDDMKKNLYNAINYKLKTCNRTIFILRDLNHYLQYSNPMYKFFKRLFNHKNIFVPKRYAYIRHSNSYQQINDLTIIDRGYNPTIIGTRGGALSASIFLAYKMGYKEVVLVGIDLLESGYFYNEDLFTRNHENLNHLIPNVDDSGPIHPHLIQSDSSISSIESYENIVRYVNERGSKVFTLLENKLLNVFAPKL